MYTLFLVEDEALELELLRDHIDWTALGVRVVGTARNGRRAWERIRELRPDIVMTDVRMPIMDGLRLAALVRDEFDWMKLIFLSGHDEFVYVKSAIEAGAVGYLLKPVDPAELAAVTDKAKAEVDKARLLKRSQAVLLGLQAERFLLRESEEERGAAWRELTRLKPDLAEGEFVSGLIRLDGPAEPPGGDSGGAVAAAADAGTEADGGTGAGAGAEAGEGAGQATGAEAMTSGDAAHGSGTPQAVSRLPEREAVLRLVHDVLEAGQTDGIAACVGRGDWFVAARCAGDAPAALWPRLAAAARSVWPAGVTVGLGGRARPLREARAMLAEARRAAAARFYLGGGRIIAAGDMPSAGLGAANAAFAAPELPPLADIADPDGIERLAAAADARLAALRDRPLPPDAVSRAVAAWLAAVFAELAKIDGWRERATADGWAAAERQETLAGLRALVARLLREAAAFVADRRQDRHAQLVGEVAAIIEAQYAEPLTIEYLAGRVYLSPNYLRALFKERKGCTVHDYLTRVRLAKALELLRERALKIKDVARGVGYDNVSYFCALFYKTQGVTPNEYRKKFL